MKIRDLQQRQAEWAKRNFGDVPAWQPHLGMIEEIGELAHAHLKEAQGIRGTAEEHQAAAKDAIGDVVIYAADYCTRMNMALSEWKSFAVLQCNEQFRAEPEMCIKRAACAAAEGRIDSVLAWLACYCYNRGWSLDECVTAAWEQVEKRDWKANPTTGASS